MSKIVQRLGFCAVCGSRVHTDENYLKTLDGYCHRNCIDDNSVSA